MKRIYTSTDLVRIGMLRASLEANDIPCMLRNEYLGGAAGDIPINECWPELWILDERDLARAEQVLARALATETVIGSAWHCERCGEQCEPQFALCWRCGQPRDRDDESPA